MRVSGDTILNGVNMTGTIYSDPIWLQSIYAYAIQAVWTGTPDGDLSLQVSSDVTDISTAIANWTDYASSTQNTGGAAGNHMWDVVQAGHKWVRVKYVHNSGTGALSLTFNAKGN